MQRELQKPFDSAPRLLGRSARVFFAQAAVSGVASRSPCFIPGKLVVQLVCVALDVPPEGIASYLLMDFSNLVLGSLAIPAAIYGLTTGRPSGRMFARRQEAVEPDVLGQVQGGDDGRAVVAAAIRARASSRW